MRVGRSAWKESAPHFQDAQLGIVNPNPGIKAAQPHIECLPAPQVRAHNEFMLPMRVTRFLAGKTVQKAGLRMLPNAFLVAVDRRGTTLHAVAPDEVLEAGDVLWFAGR